MNLNVISDFNQTILTCLALFENRSISILEIGVGTGLNAFITFLESQKIPHIQEFLSTDYAILLKNKKDLKKLIVTYSSYKSFIKKLDSFRIILNLYYNSFNKGDGKYPAGYFTFTDSVNANFHFSNFLFFSHVYLQT